MRACNGTANGNARLQNFRNRNEGNRKFQNKRTEYQPEKN